MYKKTLFLSFLSKFFLTFINHSLFMCNPLEKNEDWLMKSTTGV